MLVRAGLFQEGFENYEFRWLLEPQRSFRPPTKVGGWKGQNLRGRCVLLRFEQGIGDNFQYLRYAKYLQQLGAITRIGRFSQLEDCIDGIEQVIETTSEDHDFFVDVASLPRVFGTSLETVPAEVPYIEAKPELVDRWASRVRNVAGLKVGLVWAGNALHLRDAERSLNLLQLAPLLNVEGASFFALQKGARSEQAEEYAAANWLNLGPELANFSDTAAVMESLDLVICVDTSVAHLAGAMAKPVWLLLPKPADFRWMEDREDTPWYPTMRLFRQQTRGDWKGVIERVKDALVQQVKEGAAPRWTKKPFVGLQPAFPSHWIAGETKLPGHRPGFSAVAETRVGMVQYLPDEPVIGDAIAWYGEYLEVHVDLLAKLVAPGSTVMEIDAGIGLHALALAKMVGAEGHVMLYEADPIKKRILEQNLEVHGIRDATIMRRRIGGIAEGAPVAGDSGDKLDHETLDDLQLERLDWLKINGGRRALEVLEGAEETIWRLRPKILIADNGSNAVLVELQQRLQDLGYSCAVDLISHYNSGNRNLRDLDIFHGMTCMTLMGVPEEQGGIQ